MTDVSQIKLYTSTNDTSTVSSSASAETPSESEIKVPVGQKEEQKAQEKAAVKKEALTKLESTPITFGMTSPIATNNANASVSIPLGGATTGSDFNTDLLFSGIDASDDTKAEVKADGGFLSQVKNFFATKKADASKENTTIDLNNSLKEAGLDEIQVEDLSKNEEYQKLASELGIQSGDEIPADLKDILAESEKVQGSSADANKNITSEERNVASSEMKDLADKHKELTNKLSDTSLSKSEKDAIIKELGDITTKSTETLANTPSIDSSDAPKLQAETQKVLDDLKPEDKKALNSYLGNHTTTGTDTEDADYKTLSPEAKNAEAVLRTDVMSRA